MCGECASPDMDHLAHLVIYCVTTTDLHTASLL